MLASADKKGATLSDILRADGYGLGGASEQAVEQAIEGLALGAETVQGCALGITCTARRAIALLARLHDNRLAFGMLKSFTALSHNQERMGVQALWCFTGASNYCDCRTLGLW